MNAIRLSTLIRWVDLAQTTSALFHFDDKYYLRYVNENSKKKMQVIAVSNIRLVIAYLHSTGATPALHMIRHINNFALYTGSDRLGKFCAQFMESCDIDTKIFKSHNICGASATYLLYLGVPKSLIQADGFRSSSQTYDGYHARRDRQVAP